MLASEYSNIESASLIRELISHFVNIPKLEISLYPDKRISESELLKIHFGIKDLLKHKPLQYIIGEAEFLNLVLKVTGDVLIPRPETEELVEKVLKSKNNKAGILDIGTGSGAIAISLASKGYSDVYALDISEKALKIAKQNAATLATNITFIKANILDEGSWHKIPENLDIIVSNPPYVRNSEKKFMNKNVLEYEPKQALFVEDSNPLIFYKSIALLALKKLNPKGELWFEINEFLSTELELQMRNYFHSVEIVKDFREKDRFCILKNMK